MMIFKTIIFKMVVPVIEMRDQLVKAMQRNQLVNMMYMARDGTFSK
ncbi:hypothetical protein [Lysinibacillus capsici]